MTSAGKRRLAIVVHGGVGSSLRLSGVCRIVAAKAFSILKAGGSALDGVVEAVRLMEDDGRFNAGSGSILRLDGKTIEMDASVMNSEGRLGAVVAVRGVRNPVLLAHAVTDTPHVVLAGEGASLFATRLGLTPSLPPSERILARYEKTRRRLERGGVDVEDDRWRASDIQKLWNFRRPYKDVFSSDTVGAVALDGSGTFAAASSTGGASPMLNGRVGDTAMIGCGFYVGPYGAVAATGIGEEIIKKMLSKTVYDLIASGEDIGVAGDRGIAMFPRRIPIGLIAISGQGSAVRDNRRMAQASVSEMEAVGTT